MTPVLRIDVQGDQVEIIGPRQVVQRAVDTSLLNYVEMDGFIITQVYDPVPNGGRIMANSALRALRVREP